MDCSEIRSNLSLYADGILKEPDAACVEAHLVECPLCRESSSELHEVRNSLRRIARPEIPASLKFQLKRAIREEIAVEKTAWLPVSAATRAWLRKELMPYAVGTLASVVIGLTVLTSVFSGLRDRNQMRSPVPSGSDSVLLASNRDPFSGGDLVSPSDFAHSRMDVSRESPTVNPQGALIA